jgi:tetratricopeptide (TPR) repeat protein
MTPLPAQPARGGARSQTGSKAVPPLDASSPAEVLAARLAEEMAAFWEQGHFLVTEDFLARHPELHATPEAAVRLIYEEVCLRQEFHREQAPEEILGRFPQWRAELELLLDCHRLLQAPRAAGPVFPAVGENFGDLRLLAELGRGALGRVFLAVQPFLADRPVVLKMTPCEGQEHLALARLQHTHVVPLYWMQDFPARNLRVLCMPYLGGETLAALLRWLARLPPAQRSGAHLLDALDQARHSAPVACPFEGPARHLLARASYVQAVCWIGACLADALQYAHERGLVHLDLKPSNILLGADGQPLLLDFHLAREPLRPGSPRPEWFGGTPEYMSPEQTLVLEAVRGSQPTPVTIDGRSDIYSLAKLLYEALGGVTGVEGQPPLLQRCNPCVSRSLSDLIHKCLAKQPASRYPDAAAIATDLRRHLRDLPLRGVPNRSLTERWAKWRRRRPHALIQALLAVALAAGGCGVGAAVWLQVRQRAAEVEAAAQDADQHLLQQEYGEAVTRLTQGLEAARHAYDGGERARELTVRLRLAQRGLAARDLHRVAERVRLVADSSWLSPAILASLDEHCASAWNARALLLDREQAQLPAHVEQQLRLDLLDLALCWADVRLRLGKPQPAFEVLTEAEALAGPCLALARARQACAEELGDAVRAASAAHAAEGLTAQTAWEHEALGRALLRAGQLDEAAAELRKAVRLAPSGFWPNFYQGVCSYRQGRHLEAVAAFRTCIALAPDRAECYHNRGLALAALGRGDEAFDDYTEALRRDGGLAAPALNRALLHYDRQHYAEALADLQHALDHGADPATVFYDQALVFAARKDERAAVASLRRALEANPAHREARAFLAHFTPATP